MNDGPSRSDLDRIDELLIDRALAGLTEQEASELEGLLGRYPNVDAESFDRTVAEVDLDVQVEPHAALPPGLHAQLTAGAQRHFQNSGSLGADSPRRRRNQQGRWFTWSGWFVAAACCLIAVFVWRSDKAPPVRLSPSAQREALLESDANPLVLEWAAGPTAPNEGAIQGDVVWSAQSQRGFMTFRGLPVNDPKKEQYQLWIFDATRDERYPVDGGVFDVANDEELTVIPIHAKLRVSEVAMFAITIEESGGVVVSDRSRLPCLAQVAQK